MAPTPEEMQQRLDDLEEGNEAARQQAQDDGLLPEDDPEDQEPTLENPNPDRPGDEGLPGPATG